MKIKTIKTKVANNRKIKYINNDLSDYLQIDMYFHVFAIEIKRELIYYYIYHEYYLLPVPSIMFEIIESYLPVQLKILEVEDSLFICPELFFEPFFYDRISDHEVDLELKFKNLAYEMYPDFKAEFWNR